MAKLNENLQIEYIYDGAHRHFAIAQMLEEKTEDEHGAVIFSGDVKIPVVLYDHTVPEELMHNWMYLSNNWAVLIIILIIFTIILTLMILIIMILIIIITTHLLIIS
jgi:hypothetical protein